MGDLTWTADASEQMLAYFSGNAEVLFLKDHDQSTTITALHQMTPTARLVMIARLRAAVELVEAVCEVRAEEATS